MTDQYSMFAATTGANIREPNVSAFQDVKREREPWLARRCQREKG